MLKFNVSKKDLHNLLDKVLDEAKAIQTTAERSCYPRPLLDPRKKFEDKIARDEYTLEPKVMQVSLGLGKLQKLPRELRDMIYGYAIADGTTALVRASKQTKKETSPLIFKKEAYTDYFLGFTTITETRVSAGH